MLDEAAAWALVLALRATVDACEAPHFPLAVHQGGHRLAFAADGTCLAAPAATPEAEAVLSLYGPVAAVGRGRGFAVAHLGQSLDGRIATASGTAQWITSAADIRHNHRMRALADAVLVGAGTLRADDPLLTVRSCPGSSPVRVVIDTNRRLSSGYRAFSDGVVPTFVVAASDSAVCGDRLGAAEIIALPRGGEWIKTHAIREALAARGLTRLFIEGGGVTVSRFLAEGTLDRLQITVSPVILGSGRPGITLPQIAHPRDGLRPPVRRFALDEDVMFECILTR
jgi:riboflavin-specific deaminase-like protein